MSLREPDLMDSHVHRASSTVNHDVPVTWNANGRDQGHLHLWEHSSSLQWELLRAPGERKAYRQPGMAVLETWSLLVIVTQWLITNVKVRCQKLLMQQGWKVGLLMLLMVHPSRLTNIILYLQSLFWGKYSSCMAFHHLFNKSYYARAHRIAIQHL